MLMGGEESVLTRTAMNTRLETGLPDLEAQTGFCRCAEESGIDSLLTDFGFAKPDPILLAAAVGMATEKIKFIVAYRSGLLCPTIFVQQLNTLSTLINGRFSLNIVAGHSPEEQRFYGDYLSHDERYARTEEFLDICKSLWNRSGEVSFEGKYYKLEKAKLNTPFVANGRTSPEIFIGGSSPPARKLAVKHGTCWMQLGDTPEKVRPTVIPALEAGIEVGLRMAIIARPTHEEAVRAAHRLIEGLDAEQKDTEKEKEFVRKSDSVSIRATYGQQGDWLTSYLWTGAVRTIGAAGIALVGSPEEVASAIMEYRKIGITQFIFSGWPKLDEMLFFGKEILPLVRRKEQESERLNSSTRGYANAV
jgi:alkanesulfonate monooxygenase